MSDAFSESADLYQLGRDALEKNELSEAINFFRQSIAAMPHFKTLELLGECLIRQNLWKEAIVPLAAASALNKSVRAPSLLAEVFLHLGEYSDAEVMTDLVLSRDMTNRKALSVKEIVKQHSHDS